MYDADLAVAREAIQKRRDVWGPADFLFVPPLVSLMRNRLLKRAARAGAGRLRRAVVDTLAYFLRRHRRGHLDPPSRAVDARV